MSLNLIDSAYSNANNLVIEKRVLGSMLKSYELYTQYKDKLQTEYFFDEKNKAISKILTENNFKSLDKDVVLDKLSSFEIFKLLDIQKVNDYLVGLLDHGVNIDKGLEEQIKVLHEHHVRRKLLLLTQEIFMNVVNKKDLNELSEKARKSILDIFENNASSKSAYDLLLDFHNSFNSDKKVIRTKINALDNIIYGFDPQTITIVAGRPSMGKTALGLNLLLNISKQGFRVPFFSLEMSFNQLVTRLLAIDNNVNISNFREEGYYYSKQKDFADTFALIRDEYIIIDDTSNKLNDIIAKIKYLKTKHDIDVVIVDYLQLIRYQNNSRSREQEVAYISSVMKNEIAKELNIPVIMLAQLSRQAESRKASRPQMSDLRESGSIENDADNIILIHRPDYYDHNTMNEPEQEAELIVAKGRNTGTGIGRTMFNLPTNQFKEYEEKSNYNNLYYGTGNDYTDPF
jgi:replicative DNA helicase